MIDREMVLIYLELLDDGDISTPRLLQMVADELGCDVADVIDAIDESEDT